MLVLKILGLMILLGLYIYGVVIFRKNRAWLTYYVLATFGLVLLLVTFIRNTGLDGHIEYSELFLIKYMVLPIGISVSQIGPNTIQIFDSIGAIALTMGIESSALIESSVLIGLIGFYPAFDWRKKVRFIGLGLVLIIIANLIRIMIIITMTHFLGRETIFLAHAVIGRLFFLACVITLFWYVITRPTVDEVSKIIRGVNVG